MWSGVLDIIDPDAIARKLSGGQVEAAREALKRRKAALTEGRTHLLETTLAGASALRHMEAAREAGFIIDLHFVRLNSAELNLERIETRVAQGGHDVPKEDVLRRFERSQENLPLAIRLADTTFLYDNTKSGQPHRKVAYIERDTVLTAAKLPEWAESSITSVQQLGGGDGHPDD